ncbi:MAG: SRPBCC family protein [Nocardioides sp.]|nr:SRPBCC family protein [Nocardioides sp.]
MDLSHRFTVPTDVEETWAHFQDIAGLAECFPGAQLTSADGDSFAGTVKVKLGPIAMVYNGSGTFVEKDDSGHRFVVDAKGKDKRGNGTAGAKVTLSMGSGTDGGTDVEVLTDLAVTGKPAQFGRGVMQDVSDKLLGQFVDCLEQRLVGGPAVETVSEVPPVVAAAAAESIQGPAPVAAPTPAPTLSSAPPPRSQQAPKQDDALDLGAAVIPILAKTYWKPALGGLGVVALIIWLISRRS